MQERITEHDNDIRLACTQTSALSDHVHETGHYPIWNEVKFIDQDPHRGPLWVKEDIHLGGSTREGRFDVAKHGLSANISVTFQATLNPCLSLAVLYQCLADFWGFWERDIIELFFVKKYPLVGA